MRKDITILVVVMVGIISFIVGYSMSPTEIKTCQHACCKKAGIKAKKQEKKPVIHKEKIEAKKPAKKEVVTPTPAKPPEPIKRKEVAEKPAPVVEEEEVSGYGVEEPTSAELPEKLTPTPEEQPVEEEISGYGEEFGGYGEEFGYGY
jgi:hypothetical protein